MLPDKCISINFDVLDHFVSNYNDSIYRAIKMKPRDATPDADIESTSSAHKKESNS